jgi:hypothetical protein
MIIAGIGLMLSAAVFVFRSGAAPASPTPDPRGAIPFAEIVRVDVTEAKAAFDADTAVFVDVRGDPYFSAEHISGALNLSEDVLAVSAADLDPNAWIVTYCT